MDKENDGGRNKNETEFKELKIVQGPVEAEVIKSFLESNGIACVFRGKVVQSVHPFSADGLGQIKIMVMKKDYTLAERLLMSKKDTSQE
ncbi:MAG: DUF2007 domain-containing protein [Candidatus Aminicenantes bacterium]|nr:DUF2007 domain-containing protein [Candidatus Aminicenantes bacterium]